MPDDPDFDNFLHWNPKKPPLKRDDWWLILSLGLIGASALGLALVAIGFVLWRVYL